MNIGGESKAAWGMFLGDLDARGLKQPELVIVDGTPGLDATLVALWGEALPIQRCTVRQHRNLSGHALKQMHDELTEDYRDMIYADTAADVEKRRKALGSRLKCDADSPKGIGCRHSKTIQAPRRRGAWRDPCGTSAGIQPSSDRPTSWNSS